ncbi:HK97 family phage prohead protease [Roseomonas sp. BN140053]|uniref:HK97 family phage prohead protease n=1 Tax=Roseomonas sp. BN140053 TaxID=3391898 RepID=UPI0039E9139C
MTAAARFPDGLECRAAAELRASGRRLEGYAAVFGVAAAVGSFTETIRAGAFRASLAGRGDILALVDHDPGRLLARTSSGTLRLAEDTRGLEFALDLPETQLGRDVLALAERRDLGGMSFGFRVKDEAWPARDRRELRAVELVEISVVHSFPAYSATTITARSLAHANRSRSLAWGLL